MVATAGENLMERYPLLGERRKGSFPSLSDEEILEEGSEEDLEGGCPHPGDLSVIQRICISFRELSGTLRTFCELVAEEHFYYYN